MKTVTAFRCKKCGLVMYPGHLRCLKCNNREFEKIEPEGAAKLLTYTVIEQLPWGIDERGRIIGVVEFENGVKAMGVVQAEEVSMGQKLQAAWEPVRYIAGEDVYGFTFYPA